AIVPTEHVLSKPDREERIALEVKRVMSNLADYKQLKGWQVFDEDLPRTNSTKLRRSEIAQRCESEKAAKPSKKRAAKPFEWDDTGKAVCALIADVMDPVLLKGISPSGSNLFSPETNLNTELALDSFARMALASGLE